MYISLLLKMINGFSWPAKIMASPFKSNAINLSAKSFKIFRSSNWCCFHFHISLTDNCLNCQIAFIIKIVFSWRSLGLMCLQFFTLNLTLWYWSCLVLWSSTKASLQSSCFYLIYEELVSKTSYTHPPPDMLLIYIIDFLLQL